MSFSFSYRVSFYIQMTPVYNDAQRTLERLIIAAPLHDYVNMRGLARRAVPTLDSSRNLSHRLAVVIVQVAVRSLLMQTLFNFS